MTELWLVTTDDRAKVLGTIVLDGAGVARFTGGAEQVFRTFQKRSPHPSDRQVFQHLVERGWSNGPVKITPAPPAEPPLTAAADVMTGAMVALIPTEQDARRLAVDGGEAVDQLHVTLVYLGEAANIPDEARTAIIEAVTNAAPKQNIQADGFNLSLFNPTNADRDTCIVLGLSGEDLDGVHGAIGEAVANVEAEPAGFTIPEQHSPWIPHLTLIYTEDTAQLETLVDRTGPVIFDRIRVAYAGETTDISLTGEAAMGASATTRRRVALTAADQQAVTGTAQEYADANATMPTTAGIEGIMTVEGIESGDGRQFAEGALTWDNPPLPLMWQKVTSHGGMTDESVSIGRVDQVWRDGLEIRFRGTIDLESEDGAEAYRQIDGGYLRGNSVDVDSVKDADIELIFPDDGEPEGGEDEDGDLFIELFAMPELVLFHKGRIRGTTLVQYPAFVEAKVWLTDGTMVAGAVGSHSTATSAGSWDGPSNEQRLPAPMSESAARAAYAWVDESKVEDGQLSKLGARFLHHEIAEDGTPGAANLTACSTGIGVLNGGRGGTTIPASDRQAVYDHLAAHLRAADREPPPLEGATQEEATLDAMVAAAHTITIPDLPPSWWFDEPADTPDIGALTVTDEGRLYGYLAPANVTHRAFRGSGRRVTVPRGVDYSEFMNKTALAEAADGATLRLAAGNITMSCEHASPVDARRSDPNWATQHYENSCSIVARVRVGENQAGTWVAGALLPDVTAEQVTRMFGCALSGDWQGGKLKGALLVPVEGFPVAHSASVRVADGALVASAVPVHWAPSEPAPPPSLRPSLERLARTIGRDYQTRMGHLRARVDKHRKDQP